MMMTINQMRQLLFMANLVAIVASDGLWMNKPCIVYSHQGEVTANCSFRNLQNVPDNLPQNITALDLSHNDIALLNRSSFKRYREMRRLNLSFNKLRKLHKDAFLNLPFLHVLDIHSNQLRLDNQTYPEGLFRNQKKLKVLVAHNNSDVVQSKPVFHGNCKAVLGPQLGYPDMTFSDLVSLNLLRIDGILCATFGEGFKNIMNLSVLILGGSSGANCVINTLQNTTFVNLPTIRFLDVTSCELREIEPNCFQPLQHLHTLDLSNNVDLTIPKVGSGLFGTVNSTLEVLKINKVYRRRGAGIVVKTEHVKYLTAKSLKEIHIDGNKIELLDHNVISSLPNGIRGISAKNNNFFFGLYMFELAHLTELKWLDVSLQDQSHVNPFSVHEEQYKSEIVKLIDDNSFHVLGQMFSTIPKRMSQHIKHDVKFTHVRNKHSPNLMQLSQKPVERKMPVSEAYREVNHLPLTLNFDNRYAGWPGNFTILVPPNGTHLNVSNSKMKYTIPRGKFSQNKLKWLDLSYNFFVRWEGPIYGLDDLEYVDLSHNYCDYIGESFTNFFPSLKILNISSNYLGFSLSDNSINRLTELEVLDMSDNKITTIPGGLFDKMFRLHHLNLSVNSMKTWDTNIGYLENLTRLDISYNLFEDVPLNLRSQLDKTKNKRSIYIRGNPLKCECSQLPYLKWMYKRKYLKFDFPFNCTSDKETRIVSNSTINNLILQLEKECASYIGVLFGSFATLVLFLSIAVCGLLYRYRWKLRYLYYLTRRRYQGYERAEQEGEFEFDAFISYADEDRWLVINQMRTRLEEVEGLKLCIHHRDFLPGEAIAANILNAVASSRRTVAILSRNFLASHWCKYEVEMARMENVQTGRNTLIVVVLEDVPMSSLYGDLLQVMRHQSYIEYTSDNQGNEVFWQNLKRAILTPGNVD